MIFLPENLIVESEKYFSEAQKEAYQSTCLRRRCGTVIVKDNVIIGRGFNSPAGKNEDEKRCVYDQSLLDAKITDRTCCVHAEQRAMMDALKKGNDLTGGLIYFTSVDKEGKRLKSGKPYCTHCSKMALDIGVKAWFLEHDEGTVKYNSFEYNQISYNYHH
jgi:deoxycytidylate deaminase